MYVNPNIMLLLEPKMFTYYNCIDKKKSSTSYIRSITFGKSVNENSLFYLHLTALMSLLKHAHAQMTNL